MNTQNLLTDLTPEQEEEVNGGGIFSWLGGAIRDVFRFFGNRIVVSARVPLNGPLP